MNRKVFKKVMTSVIALTLVSGVFPTTIGGNSLSKPAIVANAAVGDIINFGDELVRGVWYASANGNKVFVGNLNNYSVEVAVAVYRYDSEKSMIAIGKEDTTMPDRELDDNKLIWVNVPSGREYEVPIGVKIISGTGEYNNSYQLELVYDDPIGDFQEVELGTKWMIGDLINTNAYFAVDIPCYYHSTYFVRKNVQFFRTNLPQCVDSTKLYDDLKSVSFNNVIIPTYLSKDEVAANSDSQGIYNSFAFNGTPESVIGIEVTGGKGTKEESFIIDPIKMINLLTANTHRLQQRTAKTIHALSL